MTPLQKLVHYLMIASFLLDLFSFINIKPNLSRVIEQLALNERKCEMCDLK
ncbi:MAG: hypothetical protein QNJ33_01965 [Crocosphaera sp.]|nr:hypothetical protein [Crocosphaera sp.]